MITFIADVMENWLDKNGLVKTRAAFTDSGNGILYSCIFMMLADDSRPFSQRRVFAKLWNSIGECEERPGLFKRNPEGSFGQETWDDYLGIAAACITIGETGIPRDILWYGISHGFVFNTDKHIETKDWLGRFPQVWILMWCAAFPWMKWMLYPALALVGKTMKLKVEDASSTQLQWVFFSACDHLGFRFKSGDPIIAAYPSAVARYYDATHPFQTASVESVDLYFRAR